MPVPPYVILKRIVREAADQQARLQELADRLPDDATDMKAQLEQARQALAQTATLAGDQASALALGDTGAVPG